MFSNYIFCQINGEIVTKHDKDLSGRQNGRRVMDLDPGISTGDGGGMDMKLSNQVYNKIKRFSQKAS